MSSNGLNQPPTTSTRPFLGFPPISVESAAKSPNASALNWSENSNFVSHSYCGNSRARDGNGNSVTFDGLGASRFICSTLFAEPPAPPLMQPLSGPVTGQREQGSNGGRRVTSSDPLQHSHSLPFTLDASLSFSAPSMQLMPGQRASPRRAGDSYTPLHPSREVHPPSQSSASPIAPQLPNFVSDRYVVSMIDSSGNFHYCLQQHSENSPSVAGGHGSPNGSPVAGRHLATSSVMASPPSGAGFDAMPQSSSPTPMQAAQSGASDGDYEYEPYNAATLSHRKVGSLDRVMCGVHGKERSAQNMVIVRNKRTNELSWRCKQANQCKYRGFERKQLVSTPPATEISPTQLPNAPPALSASALSQPSPMYPIWSCPPPAAQQYALMPLTSFPSYHGGPSNTSLGNSIPTQSGPSVPQYVQIVPDNSLSRRDAIHQASLGGRQGGQPLPPPQQWPYQFFSSYPNS